MSYAETEGQAPQPRSAWPIVLAVIGGLLLLGCLACGGIAFVLLRTVRTMGPQLQKEFEAIADTGASLEATRGFLEQLRCGQFEAAYKTTTPLYQQKHSRKDLEDLARHYPDFQKSGPIDAHRLTFSIDDPKTREFAYPFSGADARSYEVRLRVMKDGKAFLVDDVKIEEARENGSSAPAASGRTTATSPRARPSGTAPRSTAAMPGRP